jgi:dTDP-4-amino-4,6-dideoxygalactose transaminase
MIPVHRPQLPLASQLLPYLERIDKARWYSNFGPLLVEFEQRIAEFYRLIPSMVATAANGTLMLSAILNALSVSAQSICIMPSWTFVATAAAAHHAGLIPYFVDVDRSTQALMPQVLRQQLDKIKQPIAAVIVTAPFGAPIDVQSWESFYADTGIPVIIDAAAAFDSIQKIPQMRPGKIPMMVSLHATKVFGVGEAALALCNDEALVERIKSMTSFGFKNGREAFCLGFNAKLSEYTAAVGLAALDHWDQNRTRWQSLIQYYIKQLEKHSIAHCLSSEWVSNTCNVILPQQADAVLTQLSKEDVMARKWWENGCHQHAAYQHFPRANSLVNTEYLSASVLGLPLSIDTKDEIIDEIIRKLTGILAKNNQYHGEVIKF